MTLITCCKCGDEAPAKTKKAKYCDPCRTPGEHKNSTRNVLARAAEREIKRQATLARESEKRAQTEWNALPYHNDEEELAYLIEQQEKDSRYGHHLRFRKRDGSKVLVLLSELEGEFGTGEEVLDNLLLAR